MATVASYSGIDTESAERKAESTAYLILNVFFTLRIYRVLPFTMFPRNLFWSRIPIIFLFISLTVPFDKIKD